MARKYTDTSGTPSANSLVVGLCTKCKDVHLILLNKDGSQLATCQISEEVFAAIVEAKQEINKRSRH